MAVMQIGTEVVGRRVYIVGNTFAVKDQLKSAGCKWDGDRKQWYAGPSSAEAVKTIVSNLSGAEAPREDLSRVTLLGKATYKGRSYYVVHKSERTGKYHLTVLDGSIDFWAARADCQWEKSYANVEPDRRGYGGRSTTLASIRAFVKSQNDPNAVHRVQCNECGSWHNDDEDCKDCGGC